MNVWELVPFITNAVDWDLVLSAAAFKMGSIVKIVICGGFLLRNWYSKFRCKFCNHLYRVFEVVQYVCPEVEAATSS